MKLKVDVDSQRDVEKIKPFLVFEDRWGEGGCGNLRYLLPYKSATQGCSIAVPTLTSPKFKNGY